MTFALENGPKGMTVSATGEVRWKVPRAFDDKTAGVIILVKDATGRELFHVFDINVE